MPLSLMHGVAVCLWRWPSTAVTVDMHARGRVCHGGPCHVPEAEGGAMTATEAKDWHPPEGLLLAAAALCFVLCCLRGLLY